MKIKFILSFSISLLLLLFTIECDAQVSITGPSCVIASKEYQYIINGNWLQNSNMKLCIQGGKLAGSDSMCKEGKPFGAIRIVWNNIATNRLSLTTSIGNATFNVALTTKIQGGIIDSGLSVQIVDKNSIPASIICSPAAGGNCSPLYKYNWQQSGDNLKWKNIAGETFTNLNFLVPVKKTAYFRRQVTETTSTSVDYSNVATVLVIPKSEKAQKIKIK